MGNLLPLGREINVEAGIKDYKGKLPNYQTSALKIVQKFVKQHASAQSSGAAQIESRTDELAKIAYEKVWVLI